MAYISIYLFSPSYLNIMMTLIMQQFMTLQIKIYPLNITLWPISQLAKYFKMCSFHMLWLCSTMHLEAPTITLHICSHINNLLLPWLRQKKKSRKAKLGCIPLVLGDNVSNIGYMSTITRKCFFVEFKLCWPEICLNLHLLKSHFKCVGCEHMNKLPLLIINITWIFYKKSYFILFL